MGLWASIFEKGISFYNKQFFHAAFDTWADLRALPCPNPALQAKLESYCGTAYLQLGDIASAATHLEAAVSLVDSPELKARYTANLALAHRLTDPDRAYRLMREAEKSSSHLSTLQCGILYANMGDIQWLNGFYEEGLQSVLKSLHYFEECGVETHLAQSFHNVGVLYLELDHTELAEEYLLKAHGLQASLATLIELSRLCYTNGDYERSIQYANEAFPLVWSSVMSYEKDEIARFCRLLARLARYIGEPAIALRLVEKSQLLFGQMEMWHEWMNTRNISDDWAQSDATGTGFTAGLSIENIHVFLNLLDMIHAQEFIHDAYDALLDVRVWYASELGAAIGLSESEQRDLIYACRFCDYGLTAVETDVLLTPKRSPQAWSQYIQHPVLSVKMLESLALQSSVIGTIADHHEHYDGSGYPLGKRGSDISFAAQILAVADHYATEIIMHKRSHSSVLEDIAAGRGRRFHPEVADCFLRMFDV